MIKSLDFLKMNLLFLNSKLIYRVGKVKVKVKSLSRVQLFATPWTAAYQASPSMGFSRQEYWRGLPFPSPGESCWPRDRTQVSRIGGRRFNLWASREDTHQNRNYYRGSCSIILSQASEIRCMLQKWVIFTFYKSYLTMFRFLYLHYFLTTSKYFKIF